MEDPNQPQQPQSSPGQTFQPGQSVQPQSPVDPAQQPAPVPQAPVIEPAPQAPAPAAPLPAQPQYPQQTYAQPQPAYQPQQPVGPTQFAQPKQGPNVKKLLMFGGGFIAILLLLLLVVSLLGGGGLPVTTFDKEGINFTVSIPEEWQTTSADLTSLDQVIASPADITDNNNRTSATVTRSVTKEYADTQAFVSEIEGRIENLNDTSYQSLFNIEVSNMKTDSYGSDDSPAFKVVYDLKDTRTELTYKSINYYVYESESSSIVFSFLFTNEYSGLGGSANDIVNSYAAR